MSSPLRPTVLTGTQWQKARAMWSEDRDTHDIASATGCTEVTVYNGIYLLKLKGEK
jgi:hypothetical protein